MDTSNNQSEARLQVTINTSPLLALPLELRNQIYGEVLDPNPYDGWVFSDERNRAEGLWLGCTPKGYREPAGDEKWNIIDTNQLLAECQPFRFHCSGHRGDADPTNVDAVILRINKQIYNEALQVLYGSTNCEIICCQEYGHGDKYCNAGDLIQQIFLRNPAGILDTAEYPEKAYSDIVQNCSWEGQCTAAEIMNLPCLRPMRHIKIIAQWSDMFGQPLGSQWRPERHSFTQHGTLVIEILRYIDVEPVEGYNIVKGLHFSIEGGGFLKSFVKGMGIWDLPKSRQDILFRDPRLRGLYEGTTEVIRLLKSIRRTRNVTATESTGESYWKLTEPSITTDLDIEGFPWAEA